MAVMRIRKKDEHYVSMNRFFLEDPRLSFKTKGLMAYLMTKPDGWEIKYRHLVTVGPDGRQVVLTALKQAGECGYLDRRQRRNRKGQWEWDQTLWDYPSKARAERFHAQENRIPKTSASSHSKTSRDTKEGSSYIGRAAICLKCGVRLGSGGCWHEVAS